MSNPFEQYDTVRCWNDRPSDLDQANEEHLTFGRYFTVAEIVDDERVILGDVEHWKENSIFEVPVHVSRFELIDED